MDLPASAYSLSGLPAFGRITLYLVIREYYIPREADSLKAARKPDHSV
jgi:hypothetical protein